MVTAFQRLHIEPDAVDSHGFIPCWKSETKAFPYFLREPGQRAAVEEDTVVIGVSLNHSPQPAAGFVRFSACG